MVAFLLFFFKTTKLGVLQSLIEELQGPNDSVGNKNGAGRLWPGLAAWPGPEDVEGSVSGVGGLSLAHPVVALSLCVLRVVCSFFLVLC